MRGSPIFAFKAHLWQIDSSLVNCAIRYMKGIFELIELEFVGLKDQSYVQNTKFRGENLLKLALWDLFWLLESTYDPFLWYLPFELFHKVFGGILELGKIYFLKNQFDVKKWPVLGKLFAKNGYFMPLLGFKYPYGLFSWSVPWELCRKVEFLRSKNRFWDLKGQLPKTTNFRGNNE